MNPIINDISVNLQAGKAKIVKELVQQAIDAGVPVKEILDEGLLSGMNIIGMGISPAKELRKGGVVNIDSTVEAIMAITDNKLENANDIYVGQILKIPVNIATAVPTATITPTSIALTNTPAP